MANAWTPERRARQRLLITRWKPWTRASGPRTADGKAASARNSRKHGGRSRVFLAEMSRIRLFIGICRLTEQVIRQDLRYRENSTELLSLLKRLTDESLESLCGGVAGQVVPGSHQKNSRESTNEVLATQASATESLANQPWDNHRAGVAGQIILDGRQKNSRISTNEVLANHESAKESLANEPWDNHRVGVAEQIILNDRQKNSRISTNEVLAGHASATESRATVPWNSSGGGLGQPGNAGWRHDLALRNDNIGTMPAEQGLQVRTKIIDHKNDLTVGSHARPQPRAVFSSASGPRHSPIFRRPPLAASNLQVFRDLSGGANSAFS